MATYVSKLWVDRQSTNPNRRTLTWIDPDTQQEKTLTVTVTREEGTVTVEGDPFAALVMNGLEERISNAFATCDNILVSTNSPTAADGKNNDMFVKYSTSGGSTPITNLYIKISGAWVEVSVGGGGGSSTLAGLTDVNLSSPTDGQALVYDANSSKWVNGAGGSSSASGVYVGTCDTAAATAAKEVVVSADQNFVLEKGATICIKFTNTNSASNVTFSVNNGTAYPIWYNLGVYTASSDNITGRASRYITYVFDGSYWTWAGMGYFYSYSNMTQAEAEAGTAVTGRLVPPSVLKSAIQYHAIPQYNFYERVIGTNWVGETLYEKAFVFSYSEMQGGSRDSSRIMGVFVLDSNVNYKNIMIHDAQIVNDVPNNSFNVWSMPLPISSANGQYCRVQIQKSYSDPPAYDGVPFIYFDATYNASQLLDNNNLLYVFTIRYTKVTT